MKRPLSLAVAIPLFAVLVGCSQVKDAATNAVSSAAAQVGNVAADEATRRICALVQNGQISAQSKDVLSGLVATAKAAGVAAEITTPLDQIAKAGAQPPAESVSALQKACV